MNLVLDIGNNFFKLGIFQNSDLIYSHYDKNEKIKIEIEKIVSNYTEVSNALISNVSSLEISSLFNKYNIT